MAYDEWCPVVTNKVQQEKIINKGDNREILLRRFHRKHKQLKLILRKY